MPIELTETTPRSSNPPPPDASSGRVMTEPQSRPARPEAHRDQGARCGSSSRVNVAPAERIVSALAGGFLVRRAIRHPSLGGIAAAAAGGTLLYRGVTGHCAGYKLLGVSTARRPGEAGAHAGPTVIERSVTIDAAGDAIERVLAEPTTLPSIMAPFAEVSPTEGGARWSVGLPFGRHLDWETRTQEPRPGEPLRWETVPGARLPHRGSIRLRPAPGDQGTEVALRLEIEPLGAANGLVNARLVKMVPAAAIGAALRRLKSQIEAGEVPTTDNNPSARASAEPKPG